MPTKITDLTFRKIVLAQGGHSLGRCNFLSSTEEETATYNYLVVNLSEDPNEEPWRCANFRGAIQREAFDS